MLNNAWRFSQLSTSMLNNGVARTSPIFPMGKCKVRCTRPHYLAKKLTVGKNTKSFGCCINNWNELTKKNRSVPKFPCRSTRTTPCALRTGEGGILVGGVHREYFKEVSIETKTIVETIENAQGIDFLKKSKHGGFRVSIQGFDRNHSKWFRVSIFKRRSIP